MEILYKEREQRIGIFSVLPVGTVFKINNTVYMKIKDKYEECAVDLKQGLLLSNPGFDHVAVLHAELSVEDTYK